MTDVRLPGILATAVLTLNATLAAWGWTLRPERPGRWLLAGLFLPMLWVFTELAQFRGDDDRRAGSIVRWHRWCFAGAGAIVALRLAIATGILHGLLDPGWEEIGRRSSGVLYGAALVVWGNYLPKLMSPWRPRDEPFDWQGVHRFVGRAAFLAGSAMAVAAAALPISQLRSATLWIWSALAVLAIGRKFLSLATHARAERPGSLG